MKKILIYSIILLLCCPLTAFSWEHILIISPDEFMESMQPLVELKEYSLRHVTLISLSSIYNNSKYNGLRDNPEKIKKCILDYNKTQGVNYVLLIGDCDKFPVRYCRAINTEWGTKFYPADLYYADLYKSDGVTYDNWDSGNSNGIIGEIDFKGFGEKDINKLNIDKINLIPDVSVGRVPASNVDEVKTYVSKVINYELKAPGNWFKKTLWLVDGDWGSASKKDRLDGYMTGFNIIKPYTDSRWGVHATNPITRDERATIINNHINGGTGFVNYFGHGCRHSWSWVYDQYGKFNDMANMTNYNMLPIIFAVSCYTGRFHFDQCISGCIDEDKYRTTSGTDWTNKNKVATRPEPRAVQPSNFDRGCLAEDFTVMRSTGGIAYIGCGSVNEFGGEDLDKYFFEAYKNKAGDYITLGQMWDYSRTMFITNINLISYFAYLHLYKVTMFGDPSLIVGGAYTSNISGTVSNSLGTVLKGYKRYRVTGDITIPTGHSLRADSSVSILFNSGRKLKAMDSDVNNGFIIKTMSGHRTYLLSAKSLNDSTMIVPRISIEGELRVRNGGEIKFY